MRASALSLAATAFSENRVTQLGEQQGLDLLSAVRTDAIHVVRHYDLPLQTRSAKMDSRGGAFPFLEDSFELRSSQKLISVECSSPN